MATLIAFAGLGSVGGLIGWITGHTASLKTGLTTIRAIEQMTTPKDPVKREALRRLSVAATARYMAEF